MDFHLKQWKAQQQQQQQQQSDTTNHPHLHSAKIPKLTPDNNLHPSNSTLPLFVPEEASSAPSSASSTSFQRMGSSSSSSNFSWVQWQELELQALIYRYMIAGAAVPPELLQPIKKSLLHSPYFLHYSGQYQPPTALMHSGYWGRGSMDPEPGRCRRTDGKKWRCSRDVVGGQKYCERHMHRGRNRSRKPVEVPAAASSLGSGSSASAAHLQAAAGAAVAGGGGGTHFALSGSSTQSIDLFQSYSSEEPKPESKGGGLFGPHDGADDRSDGRVLRHFFDDWPRSIQDSDNGTTRSSTSLTMSMPGNNNAAAAASSDVSLKLSTGIGDGPTNPEQQQQIGNWGPSGWGPNQVASMGGPLAEALRSSSAAAHSSPTSVLHRGSRASEASFVTA